MINLILNKGFGRKKSPSKAIEIIRLSLEDFYYRVFDIILNICRHA